MATRWRLLLGIFISLIFLTWSLQGLKLDQFAQNLRHANYAWLIPGVAIYFLGVWFRTWRWHYMLRHLEEVPMNRLFRIVCIGYMGNNIYPARAGEVLRSYILKREFGIGISASLATVVIERLFDGLTMIFFVALALPFVHFDSAALADYRGRVPGGARGVPASGRQAGTGPPRLHPARDAPGARRLPGPRAGSGRPVPGRSGQPGARLRGLPHLWHERAGVAV
jgi:uncharacterized membrane protein YbhN (UPF0104 family)